jgi:hypothetical protein
LQLFHSAKYKTNQLVNEQNDILKQYSLPLGTKQPPQRHKTLAAANVVA